MKQFLIKRVHPILVHPMTIAFTSTQRLKIGPMHWNRAMQTAHDSVVVFRLVAYTFTFLVALCDIGAACAIYLLNQRRKLRFETFRLRHNVLRQHEQQLHFTRRTQLGKELRRQRQG